MAVELDEALSAPATPQEVSVARRRWSDLDPQVRRTIVAVACVEGALKLAALADLARRPADQVAGSKRRWAWAIALVNSGGAVPIGYFLFGRKRP